MQIIEQNAFIGAPIEKICIPSNVLTIGKSAFKGCQNLQNVEFDENSKLEIIECNSFSDTKISKICFSKNVLKISKSAFNDCKNIQVVQFAEDSKLDKIKSTFTGIPSNVS